jgi:hypothetical protein
MTRLLLYFHGLETYAFCPNEKFDVWQDSLSVSSFHLSKQKIDLWFIDINIFVYKFLSPYTPNLSPSNLSWILRKSFFPAVLPSWLKRYKVYNFRENHLLVFQILGPCHDLTAHAPNVNEQVILSVSKVTITCVARIFPSFRFGRPFTA